MATGHEHHQHNHRNDAGSPRFNWGLIAVIAIIGYFLISEHRAHFINYLPFVLLLACPLVYMFMHGDHDSHGDQGQDNKSIAKKDKGE